jgi:hypothetical protein
LRGAARDWWANVEEAARPADWAAFVTELRARFQPVNSAEQARARLVALVQGKRSVNDYVSGFRRLVVLVPDMSAADQLFFFTRGLRAPIATQLRVHGVTSVEAAIAMAARIGGLAEFAHSVAPGSAGSSGGYGGSAMEDVLAHLDESAPDPSSDAPGSAGASAAGDAPVTHRDLQLLLAAMQQARGGGGAGKGGRGGRSGGDSRLPRNLPRIPHLTPVQVKEYMDAGKCFACGSKEHRSRDCKARKDSLQQGN